MERVEEYPRARESVGRIQSVRPEALYDGSQERYTRIQTIQPEQSRYAEPAYVREVSVRQDPYVRQEFVEPTRPRYRYVSTARDLGQVTRTVDGDVIME